MKKILLITEPKTLNIPSDGPATANIWLEINGLHFPMLRWNDFVIVIMGWWALAMFRLMRGVSTQETVHFMDGPYLVEVAMIPNGMLRFRALKRYLDGTDEIAKGTEAATSFISGLIAQSQEIVDTCAQQNCQSNDLDILKSSLDSLKKEITRFLS